ncbi:MAG: DUF188 domain-containing protein, partial [Acetobacteraceae bacterium]|nr:DUF188 domain-containing protein [Acetobacteraceae bacterium]
SPRMTNVRMVLVGDGADAADDWIAEHIGTTDVCVTSDISLASRCLKTGARVISPIGKQWTKANIGDRPCGLRYSAASQGPKTGRLETLTPFCDARGNLVETFGR